MHKITGIFTFNDNLRLTDSSIEPMRETLLNSPQKTQTWIDTDGLIAFAYQQLDIKNANTANPLYNLDERYVVLLNGDVHFDTEEEKKLFIASETLSSPNKFLIAFKVWGIDCLSKLHGTFNCALWDSYEKKLWLIRDKVGIQAMYYSIHDGKIFFSSTIKALLKAPNQPRALNEEALYHYLSFMATPAPSTLFQGIQKLEAGTWLTINSKGDTNVQRYWDPLDQAEPLTCETEKLLAEQLLVEFKKAIYYEHPKAQGLFLNHSPKTENIKFFPHNIQEKKLFSLAYTTKQDSQLNTNTPKIKHHTCTVSVNDLTSFFEELPNLDEPPTNPSSIALYYLAKLAKKHDVDVCQNNHGIHELFFGLPQHKQLLKISSLHKLPIPSFIRNSIASHWLSNYTNQHLKAELIQRMKKNIPLFWNKTESFLDKEKKELLSPRLQKTFHEYSSWEVVQPLWERFKSKSWDSSIFNWITYSNLSIQIPELILRQAENITSLVSIKQTFPFLHHKFLSFAFSVPSSMKMQPSYLQKLLQQAVKQILPNQAEHGEDIFTKHFYTWIFHAFHKKIKEILTLFCKKTDIFNKEKVLHIANHGTHTQIWHLFVFVLWWTHHIEEQPVALQ